MSSLLRKLEGGDLRSIGRANEVATLVLRSPELLSELFDGLFVDDPSVSARAADALEKVSAKHPEWLQPYRGRLLDDVARINQKEVRWHVAQIIGRLQLSSRQRVKAVKILRKFLEESDSQIVKVSALQALADLAKQDPGLRAAVAGLARRALRSGSPSLKARARKLVDEIG